jgi:serine/threonine-protein kinase
MLIGVGCPDENALVRFASGQVTGGDLQALQLHLDGCDACRSLVAQLVSGATNRQTPDAISAPGAKLEKDAPVGRYRVDRLLGSGGMGVVYAARDVELNRVVALKMLHHGASSADARARLVREAQTMAKLSHPNLVPIFELGTRATDDFLAMEMIDGPTLDHWLREGKRGWRDVIGRLLEAGRGLEAAHAAGVVHRDFKPGNVLIGPDGRARVSDFGLARPDEDASPPSGSAPVGDPLFVTQAGAVLGTPAYMAPEQLEGNPADARSDQFSFCVTLYEALTGTRPFEGRTLDALRSRIRSGAPATLKSLPSRQLRRTLARGLALSPENRFESMGALLSSVERSLRARPAWPIAAAVVGVLAVAAVTLQLSRTQPPPALPATHTTQLFPGAQKVISAPDLNRVSVEDADIVDVKTLGKDQLLLIGMKPGRTDVKLIDSQGLVTHETVIVDARNPTLSLAIGETKHMVIPGIERIAIGDSDICDVKTVGNDEMLLIGHAEGTTTLLVWTRSAPPADSQRQAWDVVVGPKK